MTMNFKNGRRLAYCVLLLLVPGLAQADPIYGSVDTSAQQTGAQFEGNLTYFSIGLGFDAFLRVDLVNTTPEALGGRLTAIVFNNPSPLIQEISYFHNPNEFDQLYFENNGLNAGPLGPDFDFGTGVDGDQETFFIENSATTAGLQPGEVAFYLFKLKGIGLNLLSVDDFINATNPEGGHFFGAKFRGLDSPNGTTDAVSAQAGTPVPEPASVVSASFGLVAIAASWVLRRRKTHKQ